MKTDALALLVFALAFVLADCNHEVDVLTAWKTVLVDPNNILQSWDPTLVNPCTWFHVTCNTQNSVTRLDLGNANLSGYLIPQLGQLANLQYLYVQGNKLTGGIPNQLGNLTELVGLGLDHNQLSGAIPVVLGNLRFLRFMTLNSNKLSGTLPDTILQLISHGSLQILNVSDNHLAGTVRATNKKEFLTTTVIQDPKARKRSK